MKWFMLLLVCTLMLLESACAGLRSNMRRHPLAWGAGLGIAGGTALAIATRPGQCPTVINGYPYPRGSGTPPCPNPKTYDPGPK